MVHNRAVLKVYAGIWMAYTGTTAAWGSGVGLSRITWAAVLND